MLGLPDVKVPAVNPLPREFLHPASCRYCLLDLKVAQAAKLVRVHGPRKRTNADRLCRRVVGRVRRREMEMLFGPHEAIDAGGWPLFWEYWEDGGYVYHGDKIAHSHAKPLTDPDAFLSFARLASRRKPSKGSILGWVHRHGLIEEWADPDNDRSFADHWIFEQEPMSIVFFQQEACHAYKLLDLFELWRGKAVKDGKAVDELRRRVTLLDWENVPKVDGAASATVYVDGLGANVRASGEVMTDHMVLADCRTAVQNAIEPYLEGMRLVFETHGKLALRCPDLLAAMYYQFAALVDGRRPTAICPACNQVFEKTRRDKDYCNDTCRVAAKRKRERENAISDTRAHD